MCFFVQHKKMYVKKYPPLQSPQMLSLYQNVRGVEKEIEEKHKKTHDHL